MTITGGSALPKDEIDRMVKEAETHAAEDKARREAAETRNLAENAAYSTEKVLKDNEGKIPADVASEVSAAIDDVKTALKGDNDDAVKTSFEKLTEVSQKIGQALYQAEQNQAASGSTDEAPSAAADDDVVDAEIVDEDENK